MKVLALVASPRRLGNCEIIAREILGALPEGTERTMIRLTELKIETCRACYACLPAGKNCVIADDLAFLLAKVREADAVVIVSPCYFLGSHTTLKLIGDRLISVLNEGPQYAGKRCVAATVYGIPGWEGYGREAVLSFARFLHLNVVDDMLVQAANPGEAARPEVLARARELAVQLSGVPANAGSGGGETAAPEEIRCTGCGGGLFRLSAAGSVRCAVCGATGTLNSEGDGCAVRFAAGGLARFSPQGMAEHGRRLEEIKEDYLIRRGELHKIRKAWDGPDWWIRP